MTDHNAAAQQGVSPDRYRLIPRTLIFLTRDGQVLLLKGAAHKRLWANLYNGVGGHVERGEDILASARRELAEETGLQEAQLWLCGVITVDTGGNTGIGIYVLRGELAADASPLPESQEGTLEWVPFEAVNSLPLVEDLYVLLPRGLAMERGQPPFIAHLRYDGQGRIQVKFAE